MLPSYGGHLGEHEANNEEPAEVVLMSGMEENPTESQEPAPNAPEQSLLPPAPTEPPPGQYAWAPAPPASPSNSLWHRIAAGVVLAAVVAAAAGIGIGYTVARSIDARQAAQSNQQPQSPNQAINPQGQNGGSLSASAIAARIDP